MCEQTEDVLRAYLQRTLGVHEDGWSIRSSGLSGRGAFATRNFAPGEIIFHDRPIVRGPRAKPDKPMCAACHRLGRVSHCAAGCYLPICSSQCSSSPFHIRECQVVRESMNLPEGGWRLDLLGTVTPLRYLFLESEDREVVQCLQGNRGKIHGIEVDLLKHHMKDKLSKEDEDWMRLCCLIMDTNAFEYLKVFSDGSQTSLRGLYPLAAMLNNECSPNSCHVYDSDGIMRVFASRPIAAGEEITTCYSALLWSTTIRRLNLARTKHFLCSCARCADPTEFGSMLSCLPCTGSGCDGLLLPNYPLKAHSTWFCGSCMIEVSPKQIAQLQAAQGSLLQALSTAGPLTIAQWLSGQHLPAQGQVVVQLKNKLIWQLGHEAEFTWKELSQDILDLKEKCCRDVLLVLDTLKFGHCRMKGLILLELHASLCEQQRRKNGPIREETANEIHAVITTASLILQGDAAAQTELNLQLQAQIQLESTST